MGKRSTFARRPQDAYDTIDPRAVAALKPYLLRDGVRTYIEPCAGANALMGQLSDAGFGCLGSCDITEGDDALTMDFNVMAGVSLADVIITNPPWTRAILHPMILHFSAQKPTWLLFDLDWAYNASSAPYLAHCSDIVAVGRLCWIEGTNQTGKDNCSWFRFDASHDGPTIFHARRNGNA